MKESQLRVGNRGLRNPQALATRFVGPEPRAKSVYRRPTPALCSGHLGPGTAGLPRSRKFWEKKINQPREIKSWGGIWWSSEGVTGFLSVSYSVSSTFNIYLIISTRRVHARCHTLQESINKVQYFQTWACYRLCLPPLQVRKSPLNLE